METRSNFGSQKFGTTKIRNDNEDSYASINLPLTLSPPSARRYSRGQFLRRSAKVNQRYCQVNWRRCDQASDAAYCTDAHLRFSLPSSSLPRRNHQSLRVVILSLCPELSRRRGNVSDARRRPHLRQMTNGDSSCLIPYSCFFLS